MKKISKMNEVAWVIGNVMCALGVVLCTKAGLGLSMIAAPSYILHVIISRFLPWYSQGFSEYAVQAVTLAVMCLIVRRVKLKYLLSFVTAFLYGLIIDGWFWILGGNGVAESMVVRIVFFVIGNAIIGLAIAFVFRSYLVPQAPECIVKEISEKYNFKLDRVKLALDISFFILSVVLAVVAFFATGSFIGVGIGTIILTLVNSHVIRFFGKLLDRIFIFDAAFPKLEEKLK